jgi:PKD repeat protein
MILKVLSGERAKIERRRVMKKFFVVVLALLLTGAMIGMVEAAKVRKCNEFTFDATRSKAMSGQKLHYHWDFGDGTTSDAPIVTHKYEKAGEYTVKLTATDDSGVACDTGIASQVVKVNTAPVAKMNAPVAACIGMDITFDGSASMSETSKNLTYMWEFGDGARADGMTVTHAYKKGGNYGVRLTVDDNEGTECSSACNERCIKINTPPVAKAGRDIMMCNLKPQDEYTVNLDG